MGAEENREMSDTPKAGKTRRRYKQRPVISAST